MTIKQKLGTGVLACMALLTLAIGALVQIATERSVRIAAEQAVAAAGAGLEAMERADVARLDSALVALAANPALVEAFRARDRDRFLAVATPLFEALRRHHDVTHLSAHDPGRVAFARVHLPGRFGDRIERLTLRQAVASGERAAGKELGESGFALRVVVPWHRVALGLEVPVLTGRPPRNPLVRARELQAALEKHGTAAGAATTTPRSVRSASSRSGARTSSSSGTTRRARTSRASIRSSGRAR